MFDVVYLLKSNSKWPLSEQMNKIQTYGLYMQRRLQTCHFLIELLVLNPSVTMVVTIASVGTQFNLLDKPVSPPIPLLVGKECSELS